MIKVAEIPAVSGDQDLGLLGQGGSEDGGILAGQSMIICGLQVLSGRFQAKGDLSDQGLEGGILAGPLVGDVAAGFFNGQ